MILKVDNKAISHSRQRSVCCIEESVRCDVVTWLNPFSFKHSPKNLGDIELWGIRRKEEQVQPSLLPQSTRASSFLARCIGALSSTTTVFFLTVREKLSRKPITVSASMLFVVVNQCVRQLRSIMAKQLSLAPRWDGI